MRLYLSKDEAKRIISALLATTEWKPADIKLVTRIERCMQHQKPNPPDEG